MKEIDFQKDLFWQPPITERECQVLRALAETLCSAKVAERLGTSEEIVKIHCENLMRKFRATSLAHLVEMSGEYPLPCPSLPPPGTNFPFSTDL